MALICTIEAGLQGSQPYQAGGLGPLFGRRRTRAPFALDAFLERTLHAFEKLGDVRVELLFVGETELYRAEDDEEEDGVSIQELVDWAREEQQENADAASFHLILTHEDRDFSHVLSVEGETDHDPESPAIAVLDAAEPVPEEGSLTFPDAGDEEGEPLPGLRDYGGKEDELLDRLETFMQQLSGDLNRELALDDPEIESWVDEWGEYDMLRHYSPSGAAEEAAEHNA